MLTCVLLQQEVTGVCFLFASAGCRPEATCWGPPRPGGQAGAHTLCRSPTDAPVPPGLSFMNLSPQRVEDDTARASPGPPTSMSHIGHPQLALNHGGEVQPGKGAGAQIHMGTFFLVHAALHKQVPFEVWPLRILPVS